jgi:metal-responsive CopG/Arc/MetJ family transcriptional regulator
MKTAISIPDPLFEAAERLAKRLKISRSKLIQRAVQSLLDKHDDESVTEALNSVYAAGLETGHLDPRLARMQSASLGEDEW